MASDNSASSAQLEGKESVAAPKWQEPTVSLVDGVSVIHVDPEKLSNFAGFISWVRSREVGMDKGAFMISLPNEAKLPAAAEAALDLVRCRLEETIDVEEVPIKRQPLRTARTKASQPKKKKKPADFKANPVKQQILLLSDSNPNESFFACYENDISIDERECFVKSAIDPKSYADSRERTCCENILAEQGIDALQKHLYDAVRAISQDHSMRPFYGSGLDMKETIEICEGVSLNNLGSILDAMDREVPGITWPYLYCGTLHSLFSWHIEDGALWSINYLFLGAPKIWFIIPPKYFGLVDLFLSTVPCFDTCRGLLTGHKTAVCDPQVLLDVLGVPFTKIVQKPGDFVVTYPYALHAGFNAGWNIAGAANFADLSWFALGRGVPVCACEPGDVGLLRISLQKILETHRADLSKLSERGYTVFPHHHPRLIHAPSSEKLRKTAETLFPIESHASGELQNLAPVTVATKKLGNFSARVLKCPSCNQTFVQNKKCRLIDHVKKMHSGDARLLGHIQILYPDFVARTTEQTWCKECNKFITGKKSKLERHRLTPAHLKACQKQKASVN